MALNKTPRAKAAKIRIAIFGPSPSLLMSEATGRNVIDGNTRSEKRLTKTPAGRTQPTTNGQPPASTPSISPSITCSILVRFQAMMACRGVPKFEEAAYRETPAIDQYPWSAAAETPARDGRVHEA